MSDFSDNFLIVEEPATSVLHDMKLLMLSWFETSVPKVSCNNYVFRTIIVDLSSSRWSSSSVCMLYWNV